MISKDTIVSMIVGASLVFGVTVMGCAGKVAVPTEKIANAERVIYDARVGNASVNAPLDLRLSEDKLVAAKLAIVQKEYEKATRLTDEAILDAEVAKAKTQAAKAKKISSEMRENIDAMAREIERTQR